MELAKPYLPPNTAILIFVSLTKHALNMPANLENSAVATGLEKVSFIPIPKKGNAGECSNYCTIALMSHASKVMLEILQARCQQLSVSVQLLSRV